MDSKVAKTNEELVELVQKGIDVQDNLKTLYEQNKRYIYKIAKPFMKYAEADDLLQEAYIGFQEAIYAYIPGDAKLTTYAAWKIRKQCIRFIEDFSNAKRIPVATLKLIQKYKVFVQSYINNNGKEPTNEVIIKSLGLTKKRLNHIRKTMHEQYCISISSPVPGTDEQTIEETVADEFDMETEIEEKLFKEHERKVLDSAIHILKPNEQTVICSKYWDDMTQKQIARKMKISSARIGAIERKALKNLKKNDELQELINEKYGYGSEKAFHMSVKCSLNNHTSTTEQVAIKRVMVADTQKKIQRELDELFDTYRGN